MENKRRNIVVTAVFAAAFICLCVLGFLLGDLSLTGNQIGTGKLLLTVCGCSVVYCFLAGELTRNYSQMDKLWSLLPIAYTWIVAVRGGMKLRLVLFALIVTAWGLRLTINFARKGAYRLKFWTGTEDYRWAIVRKNPIFRHRILWTLFDLLFISLYQNLLVLAIGLPALACMESSVPFGPADAAAVLLALGFLILETVADEQQWRFQQTKKKLLAEGRELRELPAPWDLGFNTTGLWNRMRHPNYLGEQGIWLSLYLFVVGAGAARHGIFHWSVAGPALLVLLFMGSSALGEAISAKKYPMYPDYVRRVFKYLPLRAFRR